MMQDDFYKICFDALLDGVVVTDRSRKIIMNNAALERIFGYDQGELLHKKIDILIPSKSRKVHQTHYQKYFDAPHKFEKGKEREFLGLRKNGEIFNVGIGLNFFEYQGEFYTKALISDISWRKKNEFRIKELNIELEKEVKQQTEELLQTIKKLKIVNKKLEAEIQEKIMARNKAKLALEKEKELHQLQTKFLSLVSHEFKTPLSGILTSIGLIEKYQQKDVSVKIEKHIHSVKKLVFQLNTILDDFLFLEKTESGDLRFHITTFRFSDLLDEIIRKSNSVLKYEQTIEYITNNKNIKVYLDKNMVEIILRNVLYNAIKYSPKASKIKIEVKVDNEITVTIEDQGIGIPIDDQKHVFERFFRAKNALTIKGTGIGLNIVKHNVEALKGSLSFLSKENEGTLFKIVLPLKVD